MINKILLLLVLMTLSMSASAVDNDSSIAKFTTKHDQLDLDPYVQILSDQDHILNIDMLARGEAQDDFLPVSIIGNSFGFSKAVYWVRFTVYFEEGLEDTVLLQLDYPLIDNVTLFSPDGRGGFKEKITGDAVPFSMRDVNHRDFLFKLAEHGGESRTYYMRIETESSTEIGLTLWTATKFIEETDQTNFILGVYYGIIFLLIIAAGLAYIKIRDRLFIYYSLYLFSYFLFQFSLNGFSYQHFWPELPWFTSKAMSVFVGLAVIGALVFSGYFLQVWSRKKIFIKLIFYVLIACSVISIFISVLGNNALGIQIATASGLLASPLILIVAIRSAYAGFRPAYYFIIAWFVFLVGAFIAALLKFGLVPHNFFTLYSMQIGSTFEIILLGYALLDRFDLSRSEKNKAIENANKYISQLYNGLEQKVDERTKQLSESEAHLRTLIQTLPDLVWWKDPDGVFMGCNPKFERLVGVPQLDIIGKTDYDFVDKTLADFFREKDRVAIEAGVACSNEEEVTYASDGHVELLETIKMPMYGPDEKLIGVLGVGRDITERRRSELALLNTQKMEAIGQLTGGIAHDFNNILAIVIGNLSLLKVELTNNERAIKRIETIELSAKRAANLTKQLLGFSRNKAEQQKVTNLNWIITDMDNLLARTVTSQIEVVHQLNENLWYVALDQGDFQDALINLVLNARDAMPDSGRLILKTENCDLDNECFKIDADMKPGQYVVLSISDTGEGITTDQQKHIFEPFFTTKEQGKGTGLGLAMVFGFVNRSHGFIKVSSEVDVGTTFKIYLPKCEGEEQITAIETPVVENLPRGKETILVVDDEEMLLELAQETLEALEYKVLIATNAKQALTCLANEPEIALLITDVLMPGGMNGYELAEQAKETRPDLKVLFASGYASKKEAGDAMLNVSADMLLKPYGLSELAKRVRAILDGE